MNKLTHSSILVFAAAISQPAIAERTVGVAWDAVEDDRVSYYEVGTGPTSGAYVSFNSVGMEVVSDVAMGQPGALFIAVRACGEAPAVQCSDWSNELALYWLPAPQNVRFLP